jgi:predicted TPR repeat methyltransferase
MNRKQRRASGKAAKHAPKDAQLVQAPRDPLEWHALGIEAFRAGRLDEAAERIAKAIAGDSRKPAFHYNLAIVRKAQGRLQDAAAGYQRAIALKPDYADAHNNLGNVWNALGARDKARDSFERALCLRPDNADTHYSLGLLLGETGEQQEAVRHFHRCLECDPQDSRGVRILLAHLGHGDAPAQAAPAQMEKIYEVRARIWDREAGYFGHRLVADALAEHEPRCDLDILDIGCGTGRAGALVRGRARQLDGVDLSPAMLEKARARSVYDRLEQADLLAFLSRQRASYDVILAAAALIHFGDLQEVFQAAAQGLRGTGLFIFTLFPHETGEQDYAVASSGRLAQSGCFRHSPDYLRRLADNNGFSLLTLKAVLHEHDQDGNPVTGLLGVMRKN